MIFFETCAVHCVVTLTLASVVLAGLGCGSANYDSPQAVYDAAKVAAEAKDMQKLCGCMTPESQEILAGLMVMTGTMMREMAVGMAAMGGDAAKAEAEKRFASLDEVLKKHGVSTEDIVEKGPDVDMQADPRGAMKQLAASISDKPAFIGDMLKAYESFGEEGQGGTPADEFKAVLSDVKIEGDTATGMLAKPDAPNQKKPMYFKKVDGSWLIDFAGKFDS